MMSHKATLIQQTVLEDKPIIVNITDSDIDANKNFELKLHSDVVNTWFRREGLGLDNMTLRIGSDYDYAAGKIQLSGQTYYSVLAATGLTSIPLCPDYDNSIIYTPGNEGMTLADYTIAEHRTEYEFNRKNEVNKGWEHYIRQQKEHEIYEGEYIKAKNTFAEWSQQDQRNRSSKLKLLQQTLSLFSRELNQAESRKQTIERKKKNLTDFKNYLDQYQIWARQTRNVNANIADVEARQVDGQRKSELLEKIRQLKKSQLESKKRLEDIEMQISMERSNVGGKSNRGKSAYRKNTLLNQYAVLEKQISSAVIEIAEIENSLDPQKLKDLREKQSQLANSKPELKSIPDLDSELEKIKVSKTSARQDASQEWISKASLWYAEALNINADALAQVTKKVKQYKCILKCESQAALVDILECYLDDNHLDSTSKITNLGEKIKSWESQLGPATSLIPDLIIEKLQSLKSLYQAYSNASKEAPKMPQEGPYDLDEIEAPIKKRGRRVNLMCTFMQPCYEKEMQESGKYFVGIFGRRSEGHRPQIKGYGTAIIKNMALWLAGCALVYAAYSELWVTLVLSFFNPAAGLVALKMLAIVAIAGLAYAALENLQKDMRRGHLDALTENLKKAHTPACSGGMDSYAIAASQYTNGTIPVATPIHVDFDEERVEEIQDGHKNGSTMKSPSAPPLDK